MTGWLPKEILDHLDHAGYVAIPKDRVMELHAECSAGNWVLMQAHNPDQGTSIIKAVQHDLVRHLAIRALEEGCISLDSLTLSKEDRLFYRASLIALKPKTITEKVKP